MAKEFFCRNTHHRQTAMRLMQETTEYATLQCPQCNCVQVFTTTRSNDHAMFEKQRKEREARIERIRKEQQKVRIFV